MLEPHRLLYRSAADKKKYLWVQEVGYHLHPSIGAKAENAVIADVATGTG